MRIYRSPKGPYSDPFAGNTAIAAADVVKTARAWIDATQTEISRRSGIPQQTISAWERGRQEPPFASVMKLLGACGLDLVVTPVVREDSSGAPGRVLLTGGSAPLGAGDAAAKQRRLRRAQLRQYARERP
jgi:transcriptional regulator with XRE-family HTH domain